jgi:hypothetical protein
MSSALFLAVTAGVLVAVAALLYWSHRRGRLLAASLVLFASAAVAFGLAYAAVDTGYRDAGGSLDCYPYCTPLQDATAFGLFLAPAVAVVAAFASVLGVLDRRRATPTDRS